MRLNIPPWLSLTRTIARATGQGALDRGVRLGDHQVRPPPGTWRPSNRSGRVADAADALHVDADVDPHVPASALGAVRPGGRSRRGRRGSAPPSRSALAPWSRRSRSGRPRTPRPGGVPRRRRRSTRRPAGPRRSGGRWPAARRRSGRRSRRRSRRGPPAPSIRGPRTRATRPRGPRGGRPPPPGRGRACPAWPGSARGTRPRRRPRVSRAGRSARRGSWRRTGASRSSRMRVGAASSPPDTGGIIATSSPSWRSVVASA